MQYVGVCPGRIPNSIGLIAINSDVGEGKANHGCPASAVVSTLASHLGDPDSIPVPGACESGWWSPYRTGGFPPGTPVSPHSTRPRLN
ncbi:hypothetical protein DPMN_170711 [Dreissena polymorpha]|uniref:Uncharacterized protein n=1 Tax=Dreissena polymorpha TaxID=45954 RepID=A0A9D4E0A7_DREPO|nr:hypothetical protein DPMN_170711 [Dreissena polymorpha]